MMKLTHDGRRLLRPRGLLDPRAGHLPRPRATRRPAGPVPVPRSARPIRWSWRRLYRVTHSLRGAAGNSSHLRSRHARTSEGCARRATLAHLRERLAPETFEEVREMVVCEWPESFRFRRSQRKRLWGRGMATSLVHGPVTLKRGKLRAGRASHEAAPSSRGCSSRRVFAAVSLAVTMGLPRFERPESSCTSRPEGDQDPGHPRWVPVRQRRRVAVTTLVRHWHARCSGRRMGQRPALREELSVL